MHTTNEETIKNSAIPCMAQIKNWHLYLFIINHKKTWRLLINLIQPILILQQKSSTLLSESFSVVVTSIIKRTSLTVINLNSCPTMIIIVEVEVLNSQAWAVNVWTLSNLYMKVKLLKCGGYSYIFLAFHTYFHFDLFKYQWHSVQSKCSLVKTRKFYIMSNIPSCV